jgi:hypothetical protein
MPQSQGPMTCIEYMSLTLKRSLKNKICWWAYLNWINWMFSLQFITSSPLELCFEKLIYGRPSPPKIHQM